MNPETLAPLWIEGYAAPQSLAPGEVVSLHVSGAGSAKFDFEVARIGAAREVVHSGTGIPLAEQPVPDDASSSGCRWPATHSFTIPPGWRSGYYEITLTARAGGGTFTQRCGRTAQSSAFFVLRPAAPASRILLQLSTNTYNAYTNWGGGSLYAYNGRDKVQGNRVSFLRPLDSQFRSWESAFVQWAEKEGVALDYWTNLDLEQRPAAELAAYKLVLSVGHDEYWSWGMRDALESFIEKGGNAAFFSGNTCCWQVRPENQGNELTSHKQSATCDPLYGKGHDNLLSTLWSHHLVGRPENQLTGVGFLWGGYHRSHDQFMDGSGAYTVHRPDHWIFAGTGLKRGDAFGGKDTIVGYECDGCEMTTGPDGLPIPTGKDGTPPGFEILATAPAKWHPDDCEWYERWEKGRTGAAVLGLHQIGAGMVFTAGTTDWSHGLAGGDAAVMGITRNVLERLG